MTDQKPTEEKPVLTIHQAWELYRQIDHPHLENDSVFVGRPQDWGDPKWTYRRYSLEMELDGEKIKNVSHVWTDATGLNDIQLLQLSLSLVGTIMRPSAEEELCSNTHLSTEDIWLSEWGERPDIYEPSYGDWCYMDYDDIEIEGEDSFDGFALFSPDTEDGE